MLRHFVLGTKPRPPHKEPITAERVIYRVVGKYSKKLFMSVDSEAKGSVLGEEMMLDRKFMLLKNSNIEK